MKLIIEVEVPDDMTALVLDELDDELEYALRVFDKAPAFDGVSFGRLAFTA